MPSSHFKNQQQWVLLTSILSHKDGLKRSVIVIEKYGADHEMTENVIGHERILEL